MRKTITAEEARKAFLIDDVKEASKIVAKEIAESLDQDSSVELLTTAVSTISQEEADASDMLNKLAWIARECFLMGFVRSFQTYAEAAKQTWEELFQAPPNRDDWFLSKKYDPIQRQLKWGQKEKY